MSNTEIKRDLYRDKVLELIKESNSFLPAVRYLKDNYCYGRNLTELLDDVRSIRNEYETNDIGPWISVKSRMPFNFQDVLGCNISGYIEKVFYTQKEDKWFKSTGGKNLEPLIEYWMPLPTPPKH